MRCVTVAAMQQSLFPDGHIPSEQNKQSGGGNSISRQDLNDAQYEAVTSTEGPLLVIAGAGSGKTRTLVYRVAHLIDMGVAPENILLLTFTRKAAQEMLWRAGLLVDSSCQQVTGGTFHAIANMLLRRYGHHLGYSPNFTILDRSDAEGIINLLKSSLSLSGAGKRFPSKRVIINMISKSVNKSVPIDDLLYDEFSHLEEFADDIFTLKDHYKHFKFEHGLMDYDDLLVNWRRVLQESTDVRREVSERFAYIMVDEYQDTNPIQAEIVRLLAYNHNNVMVVGDDSQSIYSFRGADFRNIMDFPDIFPDTKIIKLEENYRSTQPILSLTNDIIARAGEKFTKALFTRVEGGVKPIVYGGRDASEESRYIVSKIQKLQEEGSALREIAVLFRSGFHSYKLEIDLTANQIPFEKRGGLKLTESAHTKDVLSYFRVHVNPDDNLSWNRILLLIDKIGPKTAQKILGIIRSADDPFDALRDYPAAPGWKQGLNQLSELFASLKDPGISLLEQFEILLKYYEPIFERIYYDDYPKRRKDLDQLKTIFEGYSDLQSFVADTALDPPEIETVEFDESDRLILSTVHSAKGLEWDTVFVINLADGRFPLAHILPGDEMEEERRLLYVAATRARHNLYLTYPLEVMSADRRFTRTKLSPFLADVTPGLYDSTGTSGYSFSTGIPDSPIAYKQRPVIPVKKEKSINTSLMQKGTNVRHPFFGEGQVERVVSDKTVDVMFDKHGLKTLHLDYARLEII